MKKQLAIALIAALLTFPAAPGLVLADTTTDSGAGAVTTTTTQTDATTSTTPSTETTPVVDQNGQTVDPGVLPDSPWYWFQMLMEKVQLALSFDPVKKAELTEKQATEDLAEAQALIKKGNTEEAEKALTRYNEKIDSAQAFLDKLKDPNSETAQKVQFALTKVNTNNMIVLGSLLEKLPPQAAQSLALNIVRSVEKAVAKAEKMEKKNGQDSAGTATDTSSTSTTDQAGTTDQVQVSQAAQKALEKFQAALGVKHTPNGLAYGYYKNKKSQVASTDGEDQNEQSTDTNTSGTSAQTAQQTQVLQQASVQAQSETKKQSLTLQSQVTLPGSSADAQKHSEERNENSSKSDKEKSHR